MGCNRPRYPIASLFRGGHSLSLFHFSSLVTVREVTAKSQPTHDVTRSYRGVWVVVAAERVGASWQHVVDPLRVGGWTWNFQSPPRMVLRNNGFPGIRIDFACVSAVLISIDNWSVVLGLRIASYCWGVLQTEWYVEATWDVFWTPEPPSWSDVEGWQPRYWVDMVKSGLHCWLCVLLNSCEGFFGVSFAGTVLDVWFWVTDVNSIRNKDIVIFFLGGHHM